MIYFETKKKIIEILTYKRTLALGRKPAQDISRFYSLYSLILQQWFTEVENIV